MLLIAISILSKAVTIFIKLTNIPHKLYFHPSLRYQLVAEKILNLWFHATLANLIKNQNFQHQSIVYVYFTMHWKSWRKKNTIVLDCYQTFSQLYPSSRCLVWNTIVWVNCSSRQREKGNYLLWLHIWNAKPWPPLLLFSPILNR